MVGTMKRSDLSWPTIRGRWEAGESFGSLERIYGVTRQSISARCRKEGWLRTPSAAELAKTDTARMLESPANKHERRTLLHGKRNLGNMQRVLDIMAGGGTYTLAAARIGMDRSTLEHWIKDDPAFGRQIEAARADRAMTRIAAVDSAVENGDWRAAGWVLERDPMTRGDFAPPNERGVPDGVPVVVNVVLPGELGALLTTPWVKPQHAPHVIEHDEAAGDDAALVGDDEGETE